MGKNDYIKTSRNLVVVTAPGPGSGKLATCLSNMYHDQINGIKSGYAKFETFPVSPTPASGQSSFARQRRQTWTMSTWLTLSHLQTYGETTVDHNRGYRDFPSPSSCMLERILGKSPMLLQQTWASTWSHAHCRWWWLSRPLSRNHPPLLPDDSRLQGRARFWICYQENPTLDEWSTSHRWTVANFKCCAYQGWKHWRTSSSSELPMAEIVTGKTFWALFGPYGCCVID